MKRAHLASGAGSMAGLNYYKASYHNYVPCQEMVVCGGWLWLMPICQECCLLMVGRRLVDDGLRLGVDLFMLDGGW